MADGLNDVWFLAASALPGGGELAGRLKAFVSVRGVLLVLAAGIACWAVAGRRLRGLPLVVWQLAPVLACAGVLCIVAPGHLIAKQPVEGPSVIELDANDAITVLDLTGIALCGLAALLAAALLPLRRSPRGLARWAWPLLGAVVAALLVIAIVTALLWARFEPDPPVHRRRGHQQPGVALIAPAQSSTCFQVLR